MLKFIKSFLGWNKQSPPAGSQAAPLPVPPEPPADMQQGNQVTPITPNEAEMLVISRLAQIFNDCLTLIDETTNPDVLFSRYELMVETITKLTAYENFSGITFYNGKPSETLEKVLAPKFFEDTVSGLINRSYQKAVQDASKLKTDKGRKNRILKYFSTMEQYKSKMNDSNLLLLEDLKRQATNP